MSNWDTFIFVIVFLDEKAFVLEVFRMNSLQLHTYIYLC